MREYNLDRPIFIWTIKISFLMLYPFFHTMYLYIWSDCKICVVDQVLVTGSIHLVGDVLKLIKKWFVGPNWKICLFSDFKVLKCCNYSRRYLTAYLFHSQLTENGLETTNRMLSIQTSFVLDIWRYIGSYQHQLGNFICWVFQASFHCSWKRKGWI
jgi:hypothetical protein